MKNCRFSLCRALILAGMVISLGACSHHPTTSSSGVDAGPKNTPEQKKAMRLL